MDIGFKLVIIGLVLVLIGLLVSILGEGGRTKFGGVVIIGPIPIAFGNSPMIIAISIILAFIFVVLVYTFFKGV
ncbi:hypothetical protein DRN46_01760 [Thermococci archaeon]|nr:MAG: hypothetical protein DRN46_01760 [Thermococci archaeon]RLF94227.1 MAG: hypothetical protein DRN52_05385 [Thermococci archaeon]